jgi:DNA-binding HxlR family transcriptional regulator
MTKSYGQYCPVARAAEAMCERWTPLILREMMSGSCHFNEISRGVPLMSRALLIKRLKEMKNAGLIIRQEKTTGKGSLYLLTEAGEALRPIIDAMGVWAQHWTSDRLTEEQLDPDLFMWSLRRGFNLEAMPEEKIVFQFDLREIPKQPIRKRSYWVIVEQRRVDVCMQTPGFEVDILIEAELSAIVHVVMGYNPLDWALKTNKINFEGDRKLVSQIPTWLYLNRERRYLSGIAPKTLGEMFG